MTYFASKKNTANTKFEFLNSKQLEFDIWHLFENCKLKISNYRLQGGRIG